MRRSILCLLVVPLLHAPAVGWQMPPVTDNPREFANFNIETTRGLIWSAVDGFLWALNTPGSQIIVHSNLDGVPNARFQTLLYPTALAEWRTDRILVVGGGSHALAIHDRATGDILNVISLLPPFGGSGEGSEPADVVVDPDNNFAFVSCQGTNSLVQIDLNNQSVQRTIEVPAERPRFLYFDKGQPGGADNRVYVAPFNSGNNSTIGAPQTPLNPGTTAEQNLARVIPASPALPDQDLFVIDSSSMASTLRPALRAAGTLLTGHGRHPNGNYWMLNVDALNQDPVLNTEPELNGVFAMNQLSIGQPAATTPPANPPAPSAIVDIDDTDPSANVTYSTATSLAFPWSLAFHPTFGFVAVTASMSDRIAAFDANGQRVPALDINLPAGSIPRHIQFDPFNAQFLAVHCWGTNTIRIHQPGTGTAPVVLDLGVDATPKTLKEGRKLWYDASRSLNGRTSCNTCHPGGKTDLLAWSLSDPPHDHKDPMVTQSLLSIEDTFPYHWRGERDLLAFNGAFTNLLGGPAVLTPAQFAQLQAFVFSLQAQANPFEDLSRDVTVSAGVQPTDPPGTSAKNGANVYMNKLTFPSGNPQFSCQSCHTLPSGTSGDWQLIEANLVPSETTFEVAHFREMRHRDQPTVNGPGPGSRPRSGFGITHDGSELNLVSAMAPFFLQGLEPFDVAAFLRQFDQGISPAAHAARFLNATSQSTVASVLQPQAVNGWIDVVAFGVARTSPTAPFLPVRWLFDPATSLYGASENGFAPMTLAQLLPSAGTTGWVVALGVPVGNGRRFALDPDNDDLVDSAETTTDRANPDSDSDTFPDGYEVQNGSFPNVTASTPNDTTPPSFTLTPRNGFPRLDFVTTSVAKFFVEADEDCQVNVTYSAPGVAPRTFNSAHLARRHTVVLQGLDGTTGVRNYTAVFTLKDRKSLPSLPSTVLFSTLPIVANPSGQAGIPESIRATSFTSNTPTRVGNTLTFTNAQVQLELRAPNGMPAPTLVGKQLVVQVLIRRNGSSVWQVSPNPTSPNAVVSGFTVTGFPVSGTVPYLLLPTPSAFVISNPVPASGIASFDVSQSGLNALDEVKLNIVAILQPTGTPLDFTTLSLGCYQMPATPIPARSIKEVF